jgi:hypothetical protein
MTFGNVTVVSRVSFHAAATAPRLLLMELGGGGAAAGCGESYGMTSACVWPGLGPSMSDCGIRAAWPAVAYLQVASEIHALRDGVYSPPRSHSSAGVAVARWAG